MSGLVVPKAGEFMGKAPAYVKSIIAWHRHRVGKKIGTCERDKAWGVPWPYTNLHSRKHTLQA